MAGRRGQSAVEAMMVVPVVAVTILTLYYLWSVIYAAENVHIRSREAVLHGDAYQSDDDTTGSSPFDGSNYKRADNQSFSFSATSSDQSLGVFGAADDVTATAVIQSN